MFERGPLRRVTIKFSNRGLFLDFSSSFPSDRYLTPLWKPICTAKHLFSLDNGPCCTLWTFKSINKLLSWKSLGSTTSRSSAALTKFPFSCVREEISRSWPTKIYFLLQFAFCRFYEIHVWWHSICGNTCQKHKVVAQKWVKRRSHLTLIAFIEFFPIPIRRSANECQGWCCPWMLQSCLVSHFRDHFDVNHPMAASPAKINWFKVVQTHKGSCWLSICFTLVVARAESEKFSAGIEPRQLEQVSCRLLKALSGSIRAYQFSNKSFSCLFKSLRPTEASRSHHCSQVFG